jgi:hypothetical protein
VSSLGSIEANAQALARYASLCQDAGWCRSSSPKCWQTIQVDDGNDLQAIDAALAAASADTRGRR